MSASSISRRLAAEVRRRGAVATASASLGWAAGYAAGRLRPDGVGSFVHEGVEHAYLHHRYHYTWLNERAFEVPLAASVLAAHDPTRVLEVGNVMAHYQPVHHQVVDKYERSSGVLNVDVVELELPAPVDLVLAVSTLEHVGFDEADGRVDPLKTVAAVQRLVSLLAPGGRLWCTVPIGYNPAIDEQLRFNELGFTSRTAMRRGPRNRWQQVPLDEVWDLAYDELLFTARGVVVAELRLPTA